VGEYELKGLNRAVLQHLFGESPNNPMYDCYPVSDLQAEYLQHLVNVSIDMQLYDYFVECDAIE
jgi:hypothetical protein